MNARNAFLPSPRGTILSGGDVARRGTNRERGDKGRKATWSLSPPEKGYGYETVKLILRSRSSRSKKSCDGESPTKGQKKAPEWEL
jgi:hypothetical protein